MKVELKRKQTRFMLRVIPFLKTLNADFFIRVVLFGGMLYYALQMMRTASEKVVMLKEPPRNSPTKFSKTFDYEKQLNQIMVQMKQEEEQKNKSNQSNKENH